MSNYLYSRFVEFPLRERYSAAEMPANYAIAGIPQWRQYTSLLEEYLSAGEGRRQQIRGIILADLNIYYPADANIERGPYGILSRRTEELILLVLILTLRRAGQTIQAPVCPRLFVSHRQPDAHFALRIAALAARQGFAYWVDVLDPALNTLSAGPVLPPYLLPLITACIIEMAILNCTHVIACMTPASPGSAWIPYEYGRIKDDVLFSVNAATWVHPTLHHIRPFDYMHLGEIHFQEPEIEFWLLAEYRRLGSTGCRLFPPHREVEIAPKLPVRKLML